MTKANRVFNFSAGPSMLPLTVIEDAAANLASYEGCGQSVMEMSHRSKEFGKIIEDAESNLREIMNIPDNYKVMFLQEMCIRDSYNTENQNCLHRHRNTVNHHTFDIRPFVSNLK